MNSGNGQVDIDQLVKELRPVVARELSDRGARDEQHAKAITLDVLASRAKEAIHRGQQPLAPDVEDGVLQGLLDELWRLLGPLERYLQDPTLEELNVNGYDQVFATYAGGAKRACPPLCGSDEELRTLLSRIAAEHGRRLDFSSTWASMQLAGGRARMTVADHTTHRPVLCLRLHRHLDIDMRDLTEWGSVSPHQGLFLEAAVAARLNIVVCGAPYSGKTTFIRALAASIPSDERLITIEHSRELALELRPELHPDVVSFEARTENIEREGAESCDIQLERALAMSPDRVIVGEVRGPEALTMLQAMNLGSDGSMCSLHASNARDAYHRLATLLATRAVSPLRYDAATDLIAHAVDLVVFLRQVKGRGRFVAQAVATSPSQELGGLMVSADEVYRPGPDGRAVPADLPGYLHERLAAAGYTMDHWRHIEAGFAPLNPSPVPRVVGRRT